MKKLILLLLPLFFSACVTVSDVGKRPPFPIDEYQSLLKQGTGTVTGQAFFKTRGGDAKKAIGSEVILNPITSYSVFWYENSYLKNAAIEDSDPMLDKFLIKTTADADGKFTFKNVPSGQYFISTKITWEHQESQYVVNTYGGVIAQRITVKDGEVLEVILTR